MDKELKSQVLRLFLQFVQKHVPLSEAVIASLGGEGREAAIWQEHGIPDSNGWLIERNRKRSANLISQLPYRYTSSLASFSRVFRSVAGSSRGVDAFHLDLCGTIEPNIDIARRIIPLVVQSRGRCLAITVADARRNASVDNFGKIEKWLSALLGFRYQRMRERLEAEQGKDRELAIMREIGFFFSITDLFLFYGRYRMPNRVRRYAYISHTSGAPFPMRTYFFHFSDKPQRIAAPKFARYLYGEWFKEPLYDLNRPPQEIVRTKETVVMSNGLKRLRAMAEAAGGEVLEALESLVAAAGNDRFTKFMGELTMLVASHGGQQLVASPTTSGKRKTTPGRKGDFLEAQVELLKAKAKSKVAYNKARIEVGMKFLEGPGRKSKKKAALTARAMFAQTQKGHRGGFMKRLAEHRPGLLNDTLAEYYTGITGVEVTLQDLRKEAGLQ